MHNVHKDLEHKKKLFISKWYLLEKDDGEKRNDLGKKVMVWNVIMQRVKFSALSWNVCLSILTNCNLVLHVKTKINSYNLFSFFFLLTKENHW